MRKYSNTKAFTIIEIITVLSIVSIIAVIGIPTYNKSVEKAKSRSAKINLQTIHSGLKIYETKNGDYGIVIMNLSLINTALNLNIIDTNFVYVIDTTSDNTDPTKVHIRAIRTNGSYKWTSAMTAITNTNLHCENLTGTCP